MAETHQKSTFAAFLSSATFQAEAQQSLGGRTRAFSCSGGLEKGEGAREDEGPSETCPAGAELEAADSSQYLNAYKMHETHEVSETDR